MDANEENLWKAEGYELMAAAFEVYNEFKFKPLATISAHQRSLMPSTSAETITRSATQTEPSAQS